MTYNEAMAIGSAADGVVKCTYAMIYDRDGNRVFSMNNANLKISDQGIVQAFCHTERYVDSDFIPVKLHTNVLKRLQQDRAMIQRRIDVNTGVVSDLYKMEADRRSKQIADIEAGREFYVKQVAVDWYPLNSNGVSREELAQAEAELKRAKQILTASAVATVI